MEGTTNEVKDEGVLRLSMRRREVPVVLFDGEGEDAVERRWTIRELDGTGRNKYLDKVKDRVKIGRDGRTQGIKSFDGFQADLLKMCLRDENGERISVEEIEGLPASTQGRLFDLAQEVSGLDRGDEDQEGNS